MYIMIKLTRVSNGDYCDVNCQVTEEISYHWLPLSTVWVCKTMLFNLINTTRVFRWHISKFTFNLSFFYSVSKWNHFSDCWFRESSFDVCSGADFWCWWQKGETCFGVPSVKGHSSNFWFEVRSTIWFSFFYYSQQHISLANIY